MSFLVPDYINRDIPLNGRQRKAIRREAWILWMKDWRNVLVYLAVIAVLLGSAMGLGWVMGWFVHSGWHLLLGLVVYAALYHFAFTLLQKFRFAPLVRRLVRRHGYEACIKCGHWLRGLTADAERCAECGAPREPIATDQRIHEQSGLPRPPGARRRLPPSGIDQWGDGDRSGAP